MLRTRYFSSFFAIALTLGSSSPSSADTRLRIESPTDGTVVLGGQSLVVNVSAPVGAFEFVGIAGREPIGIGYIARTPPYKFVFHIPASHFKPGLCRLTAVARPPSGGPVYSEPISIDIERPDAPIALWTMTPRLSLVVGRQEGFDVDGRYADRSEVGLERSTFTKYEADPPGIVSVAVDGLVTALAPGSATITVTHKGLTTRVKVTVTEKEP